jgi:hypothetical protein
VTLAAHGFLVVCFDSVARSVSDTRTHTCTVEPFGHCKLRPANTETRTHAVSVTATTGVRRK